MFDSLRVDRFQWNVWEFEVLGVALMMTMMCSYSLWFCFVWLGGRWCWCWWCCNYCIVLPIPEWYCYCLLCVVCLSLLFFLNVGLHHDFRFLNFLFTYCTCTWRHGLHPPNHQSIQSTIAKEWKQRTPTQWSTYVIVYKLSILPLRGSDSRVTWQ